jgi:serine/threonine-protein kinase
MAEVYLAEQVSLRRQVAFKVLKTELASDRTYVQRFHNEARAAAALTHANIVQIHEVGETDGVHYIAQEYVPGRNLSQLIERSGPPDVKLTVAILRQTAAALHKASQQGIVHRDIKPENIMLSPTGEVKVADFGLARIQGGDGMDLTQVGVAMGTPLYMSPEQIEGKPLDARADIYSLGVSCYHMLSGRPPFHGETALAVAVQHLNKAPPRLDDARPDLPGGLCRIVHKMMAKKPADRHQSARELLQDLRGLQIEGVESGWMDDAEEWSTAELIALTNARAEATQRLDALMQTSALLSPRRPKYGWIALGLAACLAAGVLLAISLRSEPLLAGAASNPVPERDNAWQQLYHARMVDSEPAWQSVPRLFPDDQYAVRLAKQGLVRYYLWQSGEYNKAMPHLDELAALGPSETEFVAFGIAGRTMVYDLLGDQEKAREQFAQLTPEMIDKLDPRMRRTLGEVMSRNRAKLSREAERKLDRLREVPAE